MTQNNEVSIPDQDGSAVKLRSNVDKALREMDELDVRDPDFDLKLVFAAVRGGLPLSQALIDFVFGPEE